MYNKNISEFFKEKKNGIMLLGQTWDIIVSEWRGSLWIRFLIITEWEQAENGR